MNEINIKTIKRSGHILTAKGAIEAKRCDMIWSKLEEAHKRGEIPFCMDDAKDRKSMAVWIHNHILNI